MDKVMWFDMYEKALNKMCLGNMNGAIDILKKIIDNGECVENKNLSAACATIGTCYINNPENVLKKTRYYASMAEKFEKKALELNPINNIAPFQLVMALSMQEKVQEACEVFAKYNIQLSSKILGHNPTMQERLSYKMIISSLQDYILDESKNNPDFFDKLLEIHSKYNKSLNYNLLLIDCAFAAGFYLEAANLITECLKQENIKKLSHDTVVSLASRHVYICASIAGKREICKSVERLDELLDMYKNEIDDTLMYSCISNKSTAYVQIGDKDKLRDLLKFVPEECKDNTFLYNLAYAYLNVEQYDDALRLGWSAASIKRDDLDYILLGRAYMGKGQYAKAVSIFKKGINYVRTGKEMTYRLLESTVKSIASDTEEERVNKLYKYLIQAYVGSGEYEYAEATLKMLRENGGEANSVLESSILLDIENNVRGKLQNIEEAYKILECDLYKKDNEISVLKKNMSDWYAKLVAFQKIDDTDMVDDILWDDEYSHKMDEIINSVSCYCIRTRSREYQATINNINNRFPKLTKESRNFLATAEQIYITFEKEDLMDFAPVMVEYARFVEIMLWAYINKTTEYAEEAAKQKAYHNQGETFGAATYTIKMKGGSLEQFYEKVNWIRINRNNSAHINVSREPMVKEVREYIWNSDLIDRLCSFR